jgi:hypothetical protein
MESVGGDDDEWERNRRREIHLNEQEDLAKRGRKRLNTTRFEFTASLRVAVVCFLASFRNRVLQLIKLSLAVSQTLRQHSLYYVDVRRECKRALLASLTNPILQNHDHQGNYLDSSSSSSS